MDSFSLDPERNFRMAVRNTRNLVVGLWPCPHRYLGPQEGPNGRSDARVGAFPPLQIQNPNQIGKALQREREKGGGGGGSDYDRR